MDIFHHRKVQRNCKNRKATLSTYKDKESIASSHQFSSVQKYFGNGSISPSPLHTFHPIPKPVYPYSKKRTQSGLSKGINEHFLFLRKENHLNTCYNMRKNKLKEITKANKEFYQKLNSQKSLYSNQEMSKSYKSIKEIKDRLSQSKLSSRSRTLSRQSSQQSLKSSKSVRGVLKKKDVKPMQVKALDIKKADNQQINKFKGLFHKQAAQKQTIQNEEDVIRYNSYKKNGPYMRSLKVTGRGAKEAKKGRGLSSEEGGLLHRIAEDLKENRQGSIRKAR